MQPAVVFRTVFPIGSASEQSMTEKPRFGIARTAEMPLSDFDVLRNGRTLKRELLKQENLREIRLAILGGSTTVEIRKALELFLLAHGIRAVFYESGYNRYYEDVLAENRDLWDFQPEVVFIHTNWRNVTDFPGLL